jgi:hypothetical protein
MPVGNTPRPSPDIGIIGFGAFGQLIARYLSPCFRLRAHDPAAGLQAHAHRHNVTLTTLEAAGPLSHATADCARRLHGGARQPSLWIWAVCGSSGV